MKNKFKPKTLSPIPYIALFYLFFLLLSALLHRIIKTLVCISQQRFISSNNRLSNQYVHRAVAR